ncbi:MAG: hypothetical protein ACOCUW_00650 [Gemmatimonadota bacterium]
MKKTLGSLIMLMAVSAGALSAQDPAVESRTATATITIPTLLHIDVTNTAVAFPQPSFDDFDVGHVDASSPASVIDTRGNVVHDVTIAADAATFTGPWEKPADDLGWSLDGSSFTNLTTTEADVATGVAQGSNSNVATVSYRMALDQANDVPGDYSLDFTFTVVPN